MFAKLVLIALILLLAQPSISQAALQKKDASSLTDPQAAYNPHPSKGDIELPMPNGLKLVLRAVTVPATGPLNDQPFSMGMRNVEKERGFYEKQTDAYIGAAIKFADLPSSWRKDLSADEKKGYYYYFIGKYELTNAQWNAVMGETSTERGDLPKTNITWYDVQQFLQKYNEWLLKEHIQDVPVIEGSPAYLRLPTETEWEFAARGGDRPEENQGQLDFVVENGKHVKDYAVFGASFDKPVPIGTKQPNFLGLYDVGGNVAEMVRDRFHFTIVEPSRATGGFKRRMHGSEGGLIAKGGSFLSAEESEVSHGKRVEMRMFDKMSDGSFRPHKARNLGVRLLLSTINVPGLQRSNEIVRSENDMSAGIKPTAQPKPVQKPTQSKEQIVQLDPNGDLLSELDKIYAATTSPIIKSNLDNYRDFVKDFNTALKKEQDENLLENIRSTIYKADALTNVAFRFYEINDRYNRLRNMQVGKNEEKKFAEVEQKMRTTWQQHYRNLGVATNYYRNSVNNIVKNYSKEDINRNITKLIDEYSGSDELNANFRKNTILFRDHTNFIRNNGKERLSNMMIWEKLLHQNMVNLLKAVMKSQR